MEIRTAENGRSEAVLRWLAAGLAVAFFAGVASCGGEGTGGDAGEVAMLTVAAAGPVQEQQWVADGEPAAEPAVAPVEQPVPEPEADQPEAVPETAWGRYTLGIAAWKEGELDVAETHLREWIAHAPGHAKGRVNLARVLIEVGRPYEAKEHAAIAEDLDPASGAAKRTLARAMAESGDCSGALAMYEEALWIDPDDSWSLNNMGYLLIQHGRFEDAVGPLALAVELDGTNAMFRSNLGSALHGAGHRVASLEAFDAGPLAEAFRRELLGAPARDDGPPFECPW